MLTLDFTEQLAGFFKQNKREHDGLLHYSSALADNIRHVQLEFCNTPKKEEDFASLLRMNTGTLWHKWLDDNFVAKFDNVLTEVSIDEWAPEHWGGTLDMLLQVDGLWYLYDYKVVNPLSIPFVAKTGGKSDHKWQTSGYWYAAKEMLAKKGEDLSPLIQVCYIPAFTGGQGGNQQPFIAVFEPTDKDMFDKNMTARTNLALKYREEVNESGGGIIQDSLVDCNMYEYKERKGKIVRVPHWRSKFCPYEGMKQDGVEVCGCAELSQKTLGPTAQWGHLIEEQVI